MGADSTLVFYGVRYTLSESEIEPIEERSDPRQQLARRYKLNSWFDRFATEGGSEQYYLFIGESLCSMGYEGKFEAWASRERLVTIMDRVEENLAQAGISLMPRLYIQFHPDY